MKNNFGKHTNIILKEMCKRVKAPYTKIDFKKNNWYHEYQWTPEQESHFKKWMTDYLSTNKEARTELMQYPNKLKRNCIKVAEEWLFQYGWKYPEGVYV